MRNVNNIGKSERATQDRLVKFFQEKVGYTYLGNWEKEERKLPVEEDILLEFLTTKQGYSVEVAKKAISKLIKSVTNLSNGLYEANKTVYSLLRYGVTIAEELGKPKETIHFINWKDYTNNNFAIAEEVTVKGKENTKRPDIIIYINGIAVGILELKRSKTGIEEGIVQNLDNQSDKFIPNFFTTMQLVLAGNDTQGVRYGTVGTSAKYFLKWKEETTLDFDYVLDKHILQLCNKERILELIYDFVIYDKGIKKLCRPNQFFGIKAAQTNVLTKQGGILWHTQGSGKSLTMVWLTKWVRENVKDSRVLIITDREELDSQIEGLFKGVEEPIYRTKSGKDLINTLNNKRHSLVASLVHKFGRTSEEGDFDSYIDELKASLGSDFKAKGNIFVFVDECHRTQSGKLHDAMKVILPEALFIGFTGTPLLKKDKQKSIEIFGPYIGDPYKFDEAVSDGVVLDLLYEARDVEQFITDQQSVDEWFDAETKGLTDLAKIELKKRWGTMQKVLGSKSRLEKIVFDIVKDFKVKPRLANNSGNAMLVSGSVYHACKYYELFQNAGFKECAIITSYQPHIADVKGENTGEGTITEKALKYEIYKKMLNGKDAESFEAEVKSLFINEPGRMKLLIVVDKLLTGFDAPSATYLYIDKKMQDHGLFQALCRVNRVHTADKDFGYIIDYKDLFDSIEDSINDYTSDAFDQYDEDDVSGLLKDRFEVSKERLETSLEAIRAICEPVHPKNEPSYIKYFCGNTEVKNDLERTQEFRITLYKATSGLIRAFANLANEMIKAGYTQLQANKIKAEVDFYADLRDTIKQASGDSINFKLYEAGMRQLMDMYLDAKSSKKISDFENQTLVDLIVNISSPKDGKKKKSKESVAETIDNNVRKVIVEESQTNPKYYEKMSALLDELIKQRNEESISYQEYLKRIKDLAIQITKPEDAIVYPEAINTSGKRALYDNLGEKEVLAIALDSVVKTQALDGWREHDLKFKKLKIAINSLINDEEGTDKIMNIIKANDEY